MSSAHTIATAFLAAAAGVVVGVPSAGAPAPTPPAKTAAADPQLNIAISNGATAASEGDRLTYLIKIRNLGSTSAEDLQITQSLPAGLAFVSADHAGTKVANQVTWKLSLKPGEESTLSSVGEVGKTPNEVLRLATVACASTKDGKKPLVCATHSDLLPAGAAAVKANKPTSRRLWYGLGAAGLLVVALVAFLYIQRRRAQPGPVDKGDPIKVDALTGD